MLDFGATSAEATLRVVVAPVVRELSDRGVDPSRVMLYGAVCRDVLHAAGGHTSRLRRTGDLDLAVAIADMGAYSDLVAGLCGPGSASSYRYTIAGRQVDLIPFGGVEDPEGIGPARENVLGYRQVHLAAHSVELPGTGLSIGVPSVPGYAALKLSAWADRLDGRDGEDLKYAVFWYRQDEVCSDRLYTDSGPDLDIVETLAGLPDAGTAHLLVRDACTVLGPGPTSRLRDLWTARLPNAQTRTAGLARHFVRAALDGWHLFADDAVQLAAHVDTAVLSTGRLTEGALTAAEDLAAAVEL